MEHSCDSLLCKENRFVLTVETVCAGILVRVCVCVRVVCVCVLFFVLRGSVRVCSQSEQSESRFRIQYHRKRVARRSDAMFSFMMQL